MMEVMHHFMVKADEESPEQLDMKKVLKKALPLFDGGFTVGGLIGNGDGFVIRDAHGIRPAYYYVNDEVIVAASERSAIRTVFNVGENEVKELMPGTCTDCEVQMADIPLNRYWNQKNEGLQF